MQVRKFKILVGMLFLTIFLIKMVISLAPAFLYLDNKTVSAVILQLELESKADKDGRKRMQPKKKRFLMKPICTFWPISRSLTGQKYFTILNIACISRYITPRCPHRLPMFK